MVKLIVILMILWLIITICSCYIFYLVGRTKEFDLHNKEVKEGDIHIDKSN